MTRGFTEDVGPEGYFGGVHPLSEGDTNVAKGFVSLQVYMSTWKKPTYVRVATVSLVLRASKDESTYCFAWFFS